MRKEEGRNRNAIEVKGETRFGWLGNSDGLKFQAIISGGDDFGGNVKLEGSVLTA
jgi:hypothetical protein